VLAITPEALAIIQRVTTHPRLEPTSGLRIAGDADAGSHLLIRVVNRPSSEDKVLEREGGRLYLGPGAIQRLHGHELDAVTDRDGSVRFVLRAAS
jgi:iron-sulfur cluster assembly protein